MTVKHVTSRDNPLLARLRKLAGDPGGYRRGGGVWLGGDHLGWAFLHPGGRAPQLPQKRAVSPMK